LLAKKLGMDSVEELEEAIDALEGIAPDGGELDSDEIALAREARIRSAYAEWCKEYKKKQDESRFPAFSSNFLVMEEYAAANNKEMLLNEYADCTEADYEAMQQSKPKVVPSKAAKAKVVEEDPAKVAAKAAKAAAQVEAKAEAEAKAAAKADAKAEADKNVKRCRKLKRRSKRSLPIGRQSRKKKKGRKRRRNVRTDKSLKRKISKI
jgi:hypothetical protein